VTITTDAMFRRSFTDVPAEYDSQVPKLDLALAELADVMIFMGDFGSPGLIADVPNIAQRRSARGKAFAPVSKKQIESNVRFVEVNNSLYPTPWRAERYGLSEDALARIFWTGVNVDYSGLQARGRKVKSAIEAGKQVRVRLQMALTSRSTSPAVLSS